MKIRYRLEIKAVCPVNKRADFYWCNVVSRQLIQAEHLASVIQEATKEPAFQENLCQKIANALDASVHLEGTHYVPGFSSGIKIDVWCGEEQ